MLINIIKIYIINLNLSNKVLGMKKLLSILMRAGSKQSVNHDWGKLPYILTILANCLWPIGWLYCN